MRELEVVISAETLWPACFKMEIMKKSLSWWEHCWLTVIGLVLHNVTLFLWDYVQLLCSASLMWNYKIKKLVFDVWQFHVKSKQKKIAFSQHQSIMFSFYWQFATMLQSSCFYVIYVFSPKNAQNHCKSHFYFVLC